MSEQSPDVDEQLFSIMIEFLYKLDEVAKDTAATTLFVGFNIRQLQQLLSGDKFDIFTKITNEHIKDNVVTISQNIVYTVTTTQRRLGGPITIVKFTVLPVSWRHRIEQRLQRKHTLDGIRSEIFDFAQAAPMTPQMIKQNLFRKELKNIPISDVQEYLDVMCILGIMKRRGVSYYLRGNDVPPAKPNQ